MVHLLLDNHTFNMAAAGAVSEDGGAEPTRTVRGGLDGTSRARDGLGTVSIAQTLVSRIMGGMLAELAHCILGRGGLDGTSRARGRLDTVSLARALVSLARALAPCIMGGMLAKLAPCIPSDIVEVARTSSGPCEEHRIQFLPGHTWAAFR